MRNYRLLYLFIFPLLVLSSVSGEDLSGPAGRFLRVGSSIDLLGDVDTAGKITGSCMIYNSGTGKWEDGLCSGSFSAQISTWNVFSPTGSWITNTTYYGRWRRVGDTIEIETAGDIMGTPTNTSLILSIPGGLTIDTAKLPVPGGEQVVGFGLLADGLIGNVPATVIYNGLTSVVVRSHTVSGSTVSITELSNTGPFTWSNGDKFVIKYSVPIVGWEVTTSESSSASSSLAISTGGVQVSSPTSTVNFSSGAFSAIQSPAGVANIDINMALDYINDVDTAGQSMNYTLIYNGSEWVAAPQGTSFAFSVASFSDNQSATIEMGTASGNWLTAGNMIFSASYNNGPPDSAYVSHSGWANLTMTGSGSGPTANTATATYPASPGSKTWTLNASKGAESDTEVITINFYNYRFWGTTIQASGYTETNVEGIGNSELSNSKAKTFSVTAGTNQYIVYAYPSRLGTATFTVGGFEGGFNSPDTVSLTNPSGYTEDFYVYRSVNHSLGSTTVVAN